MRKGATRRLITVALAMALCAAAIGPGARAAHAAGPAYTETAVKIAASMPDDEGNPVLLDGGVDVPSSGCPCPGVIVNHGFLGSWHDSDNVAHTMASDGYVVLRYSSRGFGASNGEVDLVGPKEVQDLLDAVHWLNDAANPVTSGSVIHNDIGQYGASYGGGHAWALALQNDPAVRTVVPTATWTDLYSALLPHDVELAAYVNGFYATGLDTVAAAQSSQLSTTDNYSQEVHRWIAEADSGADVQDVQAGLAARSVSGRYSDIHIPVFIVQGTNDGLFTQNQALSAYQALVADHVPARLYIGGIGHPPSNAATDSPEANHLFGEITAWFDHWLKGVDNGIDRMPPIEYSRTTYFNNVWDGTTRSAWSYPFGPAQRYYLCTATGPGGGTLSPTPCPAAPPAVATDVPAGSGYDQEPVTHPYIRQAIQALTGSADPSVDTAPAVLTYDAPVAAQGEALDLAGIPTLSLQVAAADELPAGVQGAAAAFQLDPKLYDVSADGSASLITRGAYSEPLNSTAPGSTDPQHEASFDVFGLSYLLPAGHHLRLTLSTSDAPYLRPTVNPFAVALFAGSSIDLPTATSLFATPPLGSPVPTIAESPLTSALLPGAALGILGAVAAWRRRRSACAAAQEPAQRML